MENTKQDLKSALSRHLECRAPELIGGNSTSLGKIDEVGKNEVTSRHRNLQSHRFILFGAFLHLVGLAMTSGCCAQPNNQLETTSIDSQRVIYYDARFLGEAVTPFQTRRELGKSVGRACQAEAELEAR